MSEQIIRATEITNLTGLSLSTIRRLETSGSFPRRIKIASNAIGWLKSDIDQWLNNFKVARHQTGGISND